MASRPSLVSPAPSTSTSCSGASAQASSPDSAPLEAEEGQLLALHRQLAHHKVAHCRVADVHGDTLLLHLLGVCQGLDAHAGHGGHVQVRAVPVQRPPCVFLVIPPESARNSFSIREI